MGNVQGQSDDESTVALRVVSQGFVDLHLAVRAGEIVDPFTLPERLGQGMEMISRLCLLGLAEDIASSVHGLSDIVRRLPVGEWGVPSFRSPFPFAEARLLTQEPVAPTEECRALASKGQPDDAYEDIHHRQLREIVQKVRSEKKLQIYSTLRERVVRKPVYERRELSDFLESNGAALADDVLRRWSLPIPLGAMNRDGSFSLCANCGGLLYPHRDKSAFPSGRCRIGPCLEDVPSSRGGLTVANATGWRVFTDDILAYWVGPGLAEIELHDELRAAGVDVGLYPRDDAADVGRTDELGIDVKSYSCPRLLGELLSERLGGLSTFDRRFVAIPDAMVDRRPRYIEDLREAYRGRMEVTFAKVGDIARLVAG